MILFDRFFYSSKCCKTVTRLTIITIIVVLLKASKGEERDEVYEKLVKMWKLWEKEKGRGGGSNFCTVEIILYGRWRIIWHKVRDVFLGELLVGLSWIWITFRMDGSGNGNTRELDGSGNARLGKGKLFHGKIISFRGFPKQFFD